MRKSVQLSTGGNNAAKLGRPAFVRSNEADPIVLFQRSIQRIAVIGQIAHQLFPAGAGQSFARRSLPPIGFHVVKRRPRAAAGIPSRSVIAMILLPLRRFVLPTPVPLFRPAEGGINRAFA